MNLDSSIFQDFVSHVLHWEGGSSSDPDDGAASCAPYPGAVHTVKGVTYCTFKAYAGSLGISPVTYDRFLQLSDRDAGKFLYKFYQDVDGDQFPDYLGLALTEAAWMSGPETAVKHLQAALNYLGAQLSVDGVIGPKTLAAAVQANQEELYIEFWNERISFIDYLGTFPKYAKWYRGWKDRIQDFLNQFPTNAGGSPAGPVGISISFLLLGAAAYLLYTMPKVKRA